MISPSGSTWVADGGAVSFALKADDGWRLASVTANDRDVLPQVKHGMLELADITEPTVVHAEFTPETVDPPQPSGYMVTATAGEHGSITPEGVVSVEPGASARFDFHPDDGYEVDQVLVNGLVKPASGLYYTLFDVRANTTLHVTFKPVTEPEPPAVKHMVRASSTPGGSIDPAGTFEVEDGASLTFKLAADEGYVLRALELNGQDVSADVRDGSFTIESVKADVALVARFALEAKPPTPVPDEEFAIAASVKGGHGSVSPAGTVRVAKGSSRAFYFYPDEGYAVSAVEVDGVQQMWTSRSYVFNNVQGNHTLAVSFKPVAVPGGSDPKGLIDVIGSALTKTGDAPRALGAGIVAFAAGAVVLAAASRRRTRKEGAIEDISRR